MGGGGKRVAGGVVTEPGAVRWWQSLQWHRLRSWTWAAAIALMVFLLWRVENAAYTAKDAAVEAHDAVERAEAVERVDDAHQCLTSWEARLGVRALFEAIVTAASNADPVVLAGFRADVEQRLPLPECDRAAAQRVVDERPLREETPQ